MKILHINSNYMGTKLHQTMIEHLDAHVTENKVFCPIYSGSAIVTIPNDNVVIDNCFTTVDRAFFYIKQRKIISSIEKNIDVSTYDIIHAYTLFTDGNAAFELSKKYSIPYVVAIRATDLQFFQYRPYLRKRGLEILKSASRIFFLADTTRNIVFKKYVSMKERPCTFNKTIVIPNGIDDFWLDNCYTERNPEATLERIDKKTVRIVCVAQIIKRKNIPLLQKAIALLNKNGWNICLTVIGKAVNKHELAKIKQDRNTIYLGPVTKENLIECYRNADIFALPSEGETFGLVYAEAMSQGLPVIYSKGQGFDGQFPEGVIGYHVDSDSPESVAEGIKAIIDKYSVIHKNTVSLATEFSWKKIVEKYWQIYQRIGRGEAD